MVAPLVALMAVHWVVYWAERMVDSKAVYLAVN